MWKCLGVAAALMLTAAASIAQETTGTIAGQIVDVQGLPIPGATIQMTGGQGERRAVTDASGRFAFRFLTPGPYNVRVELQGFKAVERRDMRRARSNRELPVALEVGAVAETVQVTAATASRRHDNDDERGNDLERDAAAGPGRPHDQRCPLSGAGRQQLRHGRRGESVDVGGSGLDNQYVIDGVNVTNQGYGALGSYSIVFGSLGNATPFDFIEEVQVKTGGYEAEFGQATGGVVNVITKSGSNTAARIAVRLHAARRRSRAGWTQYPEHQRQRADRGHPHATTAASRAAVPIVRNKLFFFGAIDPSRDVTTLHAPAGFPLESLGDVDRVRKTRDLCGEGDMAADAAASASTRRSSAIRRPATTARSGRPRCSSTTRRRSAR